MTNDDIDKHRANIIQIAGYGFMAPFGNLIINIFGFDLFRFGTIFFFIYLSFGLILFYFGIICVARSLEILEGTKNGLSS